MLIERARHDEVNAKPVTRAGAESCEGKKQRSGFDYRIESTLTRYGQHTGQIERLVGKKVKPEVSWQELRWKEGQQRPPRSRNRTSIINESFLRAIGRRALAQQAAAEMSTVRVQ